MDVFEPEVVDLHSRAVVISALNQLVDTFLKKATRSDVDALAEVRVTEDGYLLFRDGTGMPIVVTVSFGPHLDRETTQQVVGSSPVRAALGATEAIADVFAERKEPS